MWSLVAPATRSPSPFSWSTTLTTDTPLSAEAAIEPESPRTFSELGVHDDIASALAEAGITHAFPIQALTLPLALAGQDLIGQAKTGTGKTLGFGIPLLQTVTSPSDAAYADLDAPGKPQALVIVPTRELCVQVAGDLALAGGHRGIRVLAVYGGRAYEPQVDALAKGIDVVVGTPGRLIDLAQQRYLNLSNVRVLVLDEADEMLDMGFLPDVERLVSQTPARRQTMLFSATMPGQIVNLARRYMTQPTHIRATDPNDAGSTVENVEQHVWRTHSMDKPELVARILQSEGRGRTIIFSRTKRAAQRVSDELTERGFAAGAVHGDLGQGAREQALRAFRNGKVDVLVATDVAARGIDVQDVTHVINYECPDDDKTYLHRIGRTARAGASGVAITFVDWQDTTKWQVINKTLGLAFPDPIETYSNSDHVFTGLGIPRDVTGTLPTAQRNLEGLDAEAVEDLGETGKRGGSGSKSGSSSKSGSGSKSGSSSKSESGSKSGSGSKSSTSSKSDNGSSASSNSTTGSAKPKRKRTRTRKSSGTPATES